MDHDAQEAHAQSGGLSSHMQPSYHSGQTTILFHWESSRVGDDVINMGAYALRIVALQVAVGTRDLPAWVKQSAIQLRTMGAIVGIFTETRIEGSDSQT